MSRFAFLGLMGILQLPLSQTPLDATKAAASALPLIGPGAVMLLFLSLVPAGFLLRRVSIARLQRAGRWPPLSRDR